MASTRKNVCYCILDKKMTSTGNPSYEVAVIWTTERGNKYFKRIKVRNYPNFIESRIRRDFNLSATQKVTKIEES